MGRTQAPAYRDCESQERRNHRDTEAQRVQHREAGQWLLRGPDSSLCWLLGVSVPLWLIVLGEGSNARPLPFHHPHEDDWIRHFPSTGPDTTGPAALLTGLPGSASLARERCDPGFLWPSGPDAARVWLADGNGDLVEKRVK
jgi:hypothetical protein